MRRRQRVRKGLLFFELLILCIIGAAAFMIFKLDSIQRSSLDVGSLEIVPLSGNYTNIALFGLDSREGEIEGGVRSDAIMIASLNNKTGELKVVSVFRDTLLQQEDGSYDKANAAYFYGGPQEAIAMLNRNLDMNIDMYASVNFQSLSNIIDILGGVEIELTSEEIVWLNGYVVETGQVVGKTTTELDVDQPGIHNLDGIKAVAYTRIRYTAGDDFKRAERQRTVLEQIARKAKTAGPIKLMKIMDEVLPQMSTNISTSEMLKLGGNLLRLKINEMRGFPFDITTSDDVIGMEGSYAAAIGHADNVRQLHGFLFGDDQYQVSDRIRQISEDVAYLTGIYPENY